MDLTSYIASMSVSMAQANVAQSVSTAMLSKSIDSIEQSGAEVVDLINRGMDNPTEPLTHQTCCHTRTFQKEMTLYVSDQKLYHQRRYQSS